MVTYKITLEGETACSVKATGNMDTKKKHC